MEGLMADGRRRVVVIGASMAGLLTARVLADAADEVLVFDRDVLPDSAESRKGVPQGRHAHALLRAGELILEDLFPGLIQDLVGQGAQRLSWFADARWWQFDGYRSRLGDDDFEGTFLTRPFLEGSVRKRVAALTSVCIRPGVSVRGLTGRDGRITGVVIDDRGVESTVAADLVVDASGRGSQAGTWLQALGYAAPPVEQVRIDMGYASRLLRREPGQLPDRTWLCTLGTPPKCKRLGVLFPVEGDRWLVTLAGFFGDHAPTDDVGFLAFAKSLPTDDIVSVLRLAAPISAIVTHRLPSEQWRHFEKLRRPPAGCVTIGDGICSFNPIYGQGMSSAAQQAKALLRCVEKEGLSSPTLPLRFYKRAAKVVAIPWQIAAGGDFFYPETTGPRPPFVDILNGYLRKAITAAHHDPVVASAVARVQNLLAPPPSLLRPAVVLRAWRGARQASPPAEHVSVQ